jgi:hypothetical protein
VGQTAGRRPSYRDHQSGGESTTELAMRITLHARHEKVLGDRRWEPSPVKDPVETATGQYVETVAKPAADTRLVELLKLLDGLPDRENQGADRNAGRDLAVTVFARKVNESVRGILPGAGAMHSAMSSLAVASSSWLGKQAETIRASVARYSEPFTRLDLRSIRSAGLRMVVVRPAGEFSQWLTWHRRPAHDRASDFQNLLDEFDRELNQVNQRASGQPDPLNEHAPAE